MRQKSSKFGRSLMWAVVLAAVGIAAAAEISGSSKPAHAEQANAQGQAKTGKQLWWDPMLGPSSITDHPGKSAMGMDMVPYTGRAAGGAQIEIDPRVVQDMGVQTAPVTRGPLHKTVHAVGIFELPQPGMHDIALKVGGWIDKLYADQEGMHVHQGDPLFALYSPELQVAGQELISAIQSQRSLGTDAGATVKKEAENLIDSARRKLQLWDVDEREIDAIAKADHPPRDVVFYSPATGHLEDKVIVQGSAVQPAMKLMRISDHSVMWLNAQVYEQQIALVKMGQAVETTVDAIPGKTFSGKASFIYPHLDHMTRALTVRATFDNPNFELKPGMYADANLVCEPFTDVIQVPQEAVIDTGTKQLVFIDEGGGHFTPRTVRAGIRGDGDKIEILEGLNEGETVVTSGQFLMDVESRTQEAVAKLRGGEASTPQPAAPESMSATPSATSMTMPAQPAASPTTAPAQLSLVYCPMVKADWLQLPGAVSNPYLGSQMRDCGQVKSQLQAPPKDSPHAQLLSNYLALQQSLSTDHYNAKLAQQLKTDSGKLKGDEYAALRQACDQLAAAGDLKSAQSQFKAVSNALIPLLKREAGK
jgi:RND family efflux transporter MFP subunit